MMNPDNRPNILIFMMDQLRYDHLGCANNPIVRTPNIDNLAANGIIFERAYVANPLCMPARSSLLTGLPPRIHGVRTNGIPLKRDFPTLPGILKNAGYSTHAVGKLHLSTYDLPNGMGIDDVNPADYPEARQLWESKRIDKIPVPYHGFETVDFLGGHVNYVFGEYINWLDGAFPGHKKNLLPEHALEVLEADQCYKMSLDPEKHYSEWIADRTIDFLQNNAARAGGDKPFFLLCSFPDPHHPYSAPQPWCDMYNPEDMPIPNRRVGELDDLPPFYQKIYEEGAPLVSGLEGPARRTDEQLAIMLAQTCGMISFVDYQIGRILSSLQDLDLTKETLIILLSDHGDLMGDHWMIRKGPFHFEGLLKIPMIMSWPGKIAMGRKCNGLASQLDIAPTILDWCNIIIPEGEIPLEPETVNVSSPWPGYSLRGVAEGGVNSPRKAVIVENDEDYLGLRVRTLITERYKMTIYPGQEYGELFDLQEDPEERHNLWNKANDDLQKNLFQQFIEEYVLEDSPLPRRLCHA